MGALFTQLFTKVTAVIKWFSELFVAIFVSMWDVLTDLVCWGLEGLLKIVSAAVQAIDFGGFSQYTSSSSLPGEILNILGLLGVGTAIAIIALAITIRVGLQLIPFVRLGS